MQVTPLPSLPGKIRVAIVGAALLSGAIPAGHLSAKADGTPIRIQTTARPHRWVTGRAAGITGDSVVVVRDKHSDTLRYARTELRRMDVSVGQRSDAGPMAAKGAGMFGLLGLALGLGCASDDNFCDSGDVVAVTAIGAAGGAALGAVIGSFSHHEKWEAVKLGPHVSAGLRGRRSLVLTIEFWRD